MIRIGSWDIVSVPNGSIRLDGGAMFGVVPRVLWAPREDVDAQNRILLATRTLIAVSPDRKSIILTDTGPGSKWSAKEADRFDLRFDPTAVTGVLEACFGASARDVTDIIVTHLHFDHNGGLTRWVDEPDGPTTLCFPNARHWIHRRQWEHARSPSDKDRASFLPRDFDLLESAGVLHAVDGDSPESPWPGVRFLVSDGHTPGQLLPVFFDDRNELIFTGDMFPTTSHLRPAWLMAYDVEPLKTTEEKKAVLDRCQRKGSWLAFPHDHRVAAVRMDLTAGRPLVAGEIDLVPP